MLDVQKFITLRKDKKISQKELAQGVCTQATLSNFESGRKVPSYKILNTLCKRLGIEIGDIAINSNETPIAENLIKAEYHFINFDYPEIFRLLKQCDQKKITRKNDQLHFDYLSGRYALENDRDQTAALFYLRKILTEPGLAKDDLFYLLALNFCGQIYENRRNYEQAEQYYDQIIKPITHLHLKDELSVLRALTILQNLGNYYGKRHDYKESNYLLRYAYQVGSSNHSCFYFERILYRLGLNAVATDSKRMAKQHLHDARAFARFNHDQAIITKAKQILNEL